MQRSASSAIAGLGFVLTLLMFVATPALAKPPWVSIEYPTNPFDSSLSGALVLLHAYRHAAPLDQPVTGTAQGMVNGQRRSIPVQLARTSRPGVWAVRGEIPREGSWVLVLNVGSSEMGEATALVALGRNREVTSVRVPAESRGNVKIPRAATTRDIEEMLQIAVAQAAAQPEATLGSALPHLPLLAGGLLVLLPIGIFARRRTRRAE